MVRIRLRFFYVVYICSSHQFKSDSHGHFLSQNRIVCASVLFITIPLRLLFASALKRKRIERENNIILTIEEMTPRNIWKERLMCLQLLLVVLFDMLKKTKYARTQTAIAKSLEIIPEKKQQQLFLFIEQFLLIVSQLIDSNTCLQIEQLWIKHF